MKVAEDRLAELGMSVRREHTPDVLARLRITEADEKTPQRIQWEAHVRNAKSLEMKDGISWVMEEVVMAVLEDLKNDPAFVEEVKEMLREDLKGMTRGVSFRKYLSEIVRERIGEMALGTLAEHSDVIKERTKEIIDTELGPAVDRALRQAIEEHVAGIRKRSGL